MHMQFLEHFFGEPDATFFASLGLNCIRIAISYRHFEGQRASPPPSHNPKPRYRLTLHIPMPQTT